MRSYGNVVGVQLSIIALFEGLLCFVLVLNNCIHMTLFIHVLYEFTRYVHASGMSIAVYLNLWSLLLSQELASAKRM
jgi:hypothetical protein